MGINTFKVAFDEKKIDAIFSSLNQCHLPGAAIGIAIGGKPIYRKGFGLATMELGILLSPTIRMRIGSVTKHFACLAYLLLCEEGKCDLDDPMGTYLPELDPVARQITMRQAMGHVSGLPDAFDIGMQLSGVGRNVTSAEVLAVYRRIDDPVAKPGITWRYNNGVYGMLSAALERIADRPLEEIMRDRIFEPTGMFDTLLRRWDTDFVPNSATLHMSSTPPGDFEKSYLGFALVGEGGICSTVDDMLRWLAHMDAPTVGNAATWRAIKAPQRLNNGTSTGYGLGLMTDNYRGVDTIYHSGGVMGGNSQMLKVPAAGLDVVLMLNRHDVLGVKIVNQILDSCLPDLAPIKESARRPPASGNFRSPTTGRVIQLFAKEGQQIASIDGSDLSVESDDEGTLRPSRWLSLYKIELTPFGDAEKPGRIRFRDFGNVDELVALQSADSVVPEALPGKYISEWTGTKATIFVGEDGAAHLITVGQFGTATFLLECLGEGIWRAKSMGAMPLGGILTLQEGASVFRYRTGRTGPLTFRREE